MADHLLDSEELSIPDFVQLLGDLVREGDDDSLDRFTHAALTGQHPDRDTQIVLNGQGSVLSAAQSALVDQIRDYDSLLGATTTLPYREELHVYLVPPFREALKNKVHIQLKLPKFDDPDNLIWCDLGEIPNVAFAKMQHHRACVRLMFPALVGQQQHLDREAHTQLFDIIRQVFIRRLGHEQGHLPPAYDAELHRLTSPTGQLSFTTYSVQRLQLSRFGEDILAALHERRWGEGAFFLHEIRGTRGATVHNPRDGQLRRQCFNDFTSIFVDGTFDNANQRPLADGLDALPIWFVDVALEYRLRSHVLHVRKDYHRHILRHFLGCTDRQLETLMCGKRYQLDMVAQLEEFAGFRCNPRSLSGNTGIIHFNVYTTDKSLTYSRDGRQVSKSINYKDVLSAPKDEYVAEMKRMYSTLRHASSADPPLDGHVRVEIRLKVQNATTNLVSLPDTLWKPMIMAHKGEDWWLFKSLRSWAMAHLVLKLAQAPQRLSRRPHSIALYAAMVYTFNALNSRPREGSAETDLLSVCLPRRIAMPDEIDSDEDDNSQYITFNPYGIFFLRGLVLQPCPKLPQGRQLKPRTYEVLLGGTQDDLVITVQNVILQQPPRRRVADHVSNKDKRTCIFQPNETDEEIMGELQAELMNDNNLQLPEDIPDGFDDDVEGGDRRNLVGLLVGIFMQFRSDILQKSPIAKSKKNYLKLAVNRLNPEEGVFTDKHLSRYWISLQLKRAHDPEWKTNIGKLFPTDVGAVKSWTQNFRQCAYLLQWGKLVSQFLERGDKQNVRKIERAMRKLLDRMIWLPAVSGRLWDTRARPSFRRKGDATLFGPAILLHPRIDENDIRWEGENAHVWREQQREEEEEEESD